MELREYQKRPVERCIHYFESNEYAPKLAVLPTAWGKSHLIAHVANACQHKFLILQPTKELLEQNVSKYNLLGNEAAIYSASFNSHEIGDVTYATLGSIKTLGKVFKDYHIIIDEADRFPREGGMLGKFLEDSGVTKVLGVTATPLKLAQCYDRWGNNATKLVMLTSKYKNERFYNDIITISQPSELSESGYWSKLIYDIPEGIDTSLLSYNTTGSDFSTETQASFYFRNRLDEKIIADLAEHKDRKSVLIFVPQVHIAEDLARKCPEIKAVSGKTPDKERREIIEDFRAGRIRAVANCNLLSIGFDHPEIDMIIGARPTASIAWYMQSIGRGVRISDEKENVLIKDYSGNFQKFGRIEGLFYSKNYVWHLYNENNKQLTGVILSDEDSVTSEPAFRKKEVYTMPFGKYKGKKLEELPKDYIKWLVEADLDFYDQGLKNKIIEKHESYQNC